MPVFVDANLLVYARDASEPEKQPQALEWIEHLWRTMGRAARRPASAGHTAGTAVAGLRGHGH